jgi:bifunctional DNA-binding transcriptional regulator/antitoxin component of YhaV-PrlF toxin-antitoxin module
MLAKLTSKNQLTLPKKALEALGDVTHFEVEVAEDHLVLRPARIGAAAAVRRKLAELGVSDEDVTNAVTWAREQR